jgi:hypothetical protein
MRKTFNTGVARTLGGIAINDGDRLIGFLVVRSAGYDAIDASGRRVGHFSSAQAGSTALIARATSARCQAGG